MKNLFFAAITVVALNSNAQVMSFCDSGAQKVASAAFEVTHPTETILSVDSEATHYVGRHTKMYTVNITSSQKTAAYEVQVFEFETEGTDCVIDSVKTVK